MLGSLFRREASYPISGINNPNTPIYQALAGLELGGYGPGSSGAMVTTTTAMRVVAVMACVRLIAETCASLPLGVYRREQAGRVELRNPSEEYLWKRPNPEMSKQTFWETAFGSAILTGDSYTYKVYNGLNNLAELWPLNPRRVSPYRDSKGNKRYHVDGQDTDPREIMHVPGYGDGFKGISVIGNAREALGLAMAAEEFGARFFGQGSTMSGILTTEGTLDDKTADKLAERWKQSNSGLRNSHKTAILEGGLKWQQVGVNPEDGQFLETRKFQVEEIARLFRVPPHMIGAVDKTTSWGTGIEQQTIGFITYTLRPWLTRFEQAISDELLGPTNRYAQWNVNGLLRGDMASRAAWYQTMRNIRVMNPNQIAELEDLPTYPGGDDYDASFNSATSGKVSDTPADTPAAQQQGGGQ